ncbi:Nramp family divalent metal transporter [bacterium endosymbiont of Pedicinus badii]|uniref:Nramp family divalent metal transporter n=1 Tax=bacterium endosymbiont of Pedicinus badii TaxID=1719126 RepID=UPI0009BC0B39|nr:Nramp family divalent metal transporter [bacterium endosymbiont of Pedicinus badii]OQM34428.1 manganese transporter [bacterium endosymbiont of Pedicinus badii]
MKKKVSLPEINNTVPVFKKNRNFFRNLFAFSGPGSLVAVGYMDPGNWITSIQGGALYEYLLISVIFVSSIIAMFLQVLCIKLGIVTGMDLAQATNFLVKNKKINLCLWIIAELSIIATETAEIIGSTIALSLLFKIPIIFGTIITILDVLLLLELTKFGIRKIEAIVFTLIFTVFLIFCYEVFLANPDMKKIFLSLLPNKKILYSYSNGNDSSFFISLGIIGATIMPHNLYLHSSIVQSRRYIRENEKDIKESIKYAIFDSNIQLSFSLIINCLLLILGASLFFGKSPETVGKIFKIYYSLQNKNTIGEIASSTLSNLFAIALLISGQSASITGALSGQIVMEGFLNFRISIWKRKMITRFFAIIPVLFCIFFYGNNNDKIEKLLIYTQIFLSIALPVSIIPLLYITSSKKIMKNFVNKKYQIFFGFLIAFILIILNIRLILEIFFS